MKLEPPGEFAEVDTLSFGPLFTEVRGLASTSLLHKKPSLENCYQPYATREGSLIQPTLPGRRPQPTQPGLGARATSPTGNEQPGHGPGDDEQRRGDGGREPARPRRELAHGARPPVRRSKRLQQALFKPSNIFAASSPIKKSKRFLRHRLCRHKLTECVCSA